MRPCTTWRPLRALSVPIESSERQETRSGGRRWPDPFVSRATTSWARVSGRSMEPTIPDGSHCLFRTDRGGSRQGQAGARVAAWRCRPRARGRVLRQEIREHQGGLLGWRLEPSRDTAQAVESRSGVSRSRLHARGRRRSACDRRVRRCARSSCANHHGRPSRLCPLRQPRPSPRRDRGQEKRHQPLCGQAAGAPLRESARCAVHLPDQRRAHLLLGLPE